MENIYFNGKIITMEAETEEEAITSMPEAVLVRDGMIIAVGSLSEIKCEAALNAEMIDLSGNCLMPAFIDSHSHAYMNGQMSCCAYLGDCRSYLEIVDTLKAFLETNIIDADGVLLGFGYDHNFLKEAGQPDKRVLDRVSTDVPIIILHVSAHLACANSRALELAGITEETPDPSGGMIGRIGDGKIPSGYLEERGIAMIQKLIEERFKPDFSVVLSGMQEDYIKNGVTTVQDGATTEVEIEALKSISNAGRLKIDIVAYPLMSAGGKNIIHNNQALCEGYRDHLKIGGYKLVLDGSPQGRSAWMSEPYLGDNTDYCGYPWISDEQVKEYVMTAVQEGKQVLAHCNGDAASEQYLNAYEEVLKETGIREDLRPVMIHCQTVRNDQLDRMSGMNMIASVFVGHVYYWGDIHMKNLGDVRGNHISPVKDALSRGVRVNFHQDTPVTRPDMLHSVWCAVNRVSRSGTIIGGDQKISAYDALKAITVNGAYQYFEEDSKGTISVGKRADLVILDASPLEVDPIDIKDIRILETIKDGECIYKFS